MADGLLVLAARLRGVLEADREVQLAAPHALGQLGRAALLDEHLGSGHASHRLRHQRGQRAREPAHAQPLVAGQLRELRPRELEPIGQRIRVLEQDPARDRQLQAAGLAVEQARADLLLERRDLLRDRRLGQRQRACRGAERALVRYRAKRQQSPRVH